MAAHSDCATLTAESSRPWFVYVIECVDGSLYTGIAVDVALRFSRHAAGKGARYTRAHPPLRIAAVLELPDRASALRTEYRIKQLGTAEKREFCRLNLPR